jgi:hypothetical protein
MQRPSTDTGEAMTIALLLTALALLILVAYLFSPGTWEFDGKRRTRLESWWITRQMRRDVARIPRVERERVHQ